LTRAIASRGVKSECSDAFHPADILMRFWRLHTAPAPAGHIEIGRVAALMSAAASGDTDALAGAFLDTASTVAPFSQCTVFSYEPDQRPRTAGVADRRGGAYLRTVADLYTRLYYPLDGNQPVVAAAQSRAAPADLFLHHQSRTDIAHDAYRRACYDSPNVSERVAVLLPANGRQWLSVNLYRAGEMQAREIEGLEALAPLFAHCARQQFTHRAAALDATSLMLERIDAACPDLTKRERDTVRGVLEGRTAAQIAEAMGVGLASVHTYTKRAYQRLGIASQRELFALGVGTARTR
jgi:DNA-binding CsgD family transcriptional regulator